MKSIYFIAIFFVLSYAGFSQSGVLFDRYYISGSLSVGQSNRLFADSSSWLQLGKDTSAKGILFPRVLLDSIHTAKRALFVYDLKDSVLYHFDGNKRVRYMTYKDTVLVKQICTIYRNTDSIAEGNNNLYYTTQRARSAISAATGINYNSSTGVISNTGVTSLDGTTGVLNLTNSYHKQGGNAISGTSVIGNTGNFGVNIITNNTTKFSLSNAGKATFTGSTAEDIITIGNDKTNKLVLGVGRNGGYASDNFPFVLFGGNPNSDPIITVPPVSNGNRMDINKIEALMLSCPNIANTPELRGAVFSGASGSVLGLGSRANAAGGGHTGTSGSLNWLTIPWHVGANSDIVPISGNMEFNIINIAPKVNQTGTATGVVRGLYINPSLTSAPDFRAVVMANTSGYGIFQSGAAVKNRFNGLVGIGGDADLAAALKVTGDVLLTGTIKTAQPSVNGAGAVKIGKVVTGVSVTVQTDQYLEVEIDGVVKKLAIVN